MLKTLALKILSGLGGPVKWIASFLLERLIKFATDWIKSYLENRKRDKEDQKAEEKYEEVVNKGEDATIEERRKAADDFLNGRNP